MAEYPDDGDLRAFLAMALYNAGERHEAVRILLDPLATTSYDPSASSTAVPPPFTPPRTSTPRDDGGTVREPPD
ncbi:hypothetical protein ACPB9J_06210 [Streptomyces lavendulocolor]|uniref:hypothetical protein n=1 Tax=Streptomyces lavendulocolor TaxID=67316 RepID=UPI003C2DA472